MCVWCACACVLCLRAQLVFGGAIYFTPKLGSDSQPRNSILQKCFLRPTKKPLIDVSCIVTSDENISTVIETDIKSDIPTTTLSSATIQWMHGKWPYT